jgi:hypothetical protein
MRNNFAKAHEVRFLFLFHEIPFVRERPPNIAIGREPRDDIMQVTVIRIRRHPVEAPMPLVVGMEQNDVCLDAEFLQIQDALFQVLKIFRIKPREIPVGQRLAFKRIHNRLVGVPLIMFGKDAKANFIEG